MARNEASEFAESAERRRLASNFILAVKNSGRFSWMGIFETKDALQRPRVTVCVKERAEPLPDDPKHPSKKNILPSFRELSLAFRPRLFLDLYYNRSSTENSDQLVEETKQDIRERYGSDDYEAPAILLWQQEFPINVSPPRP